MSVSPEHVEGWHSGPACEYVPYTLQKTRFHITVSKTGWIGDYVLYVRAAGGIKQHRRTKNTNPLTATDIKDFSKIIIQIPEINYRQTEKKYLSLIKCFQLNLIAQRA